MTKSFILVLISIFFVILGASQSYPKDNADLIEIIKNDTMLSEGDVGFMTYHKRKMIISVGIASIKKSSSKDILQARKSSKLNAKRYLMQFIHGTKTKTYEELQSIIIVKTTVENGKVIETSSDEQERYIEIFREKGKGILKDVIDIGKWKNTDDSAYYYALGAYID